MESRNAKFLENDLVSGSDISLGVRSESDYSISQSSISSHGRTIIVHHAPQVQVRVEQPVSEPPQAVVDDLVDPVQQMPEIVEELVEQHAPQEDIGATLRRSTKVRQSAIPDDYIVYLQECEYNVGAKNDPKTYSQAMSCNKSDLWYNAMKDEMDSMASNGVWDLVEFPNDVKAIRCK